MRSPGAVLIGLVAILALVGTTPANGDARPRFAAFDLTVDAGDVPLAAWQVEVRYDPATTKILSLEGGETAAFRDAPHYDRRGFTGGRIVIAAFAGRDEDAPRGATRVGRLHLRTEGDAAPPTVRLVTAARPGGEKIEARATLAPASAEEEGK